MRAQLGCIRILICTQDDSLLIHAGSAESSISSLKLEIEQLQESLQNVRSQALQQAKEKGSAVVRALTSAC
eukprot:86055-Pelagomonas_calceolata.AAC.9